MCPIVNELNVRKNEYETVVTVTGQHREMLDQTLRVFVIAPRPASSPRSPASARRSPWDTSRPAFVCTTPTAPWPEEFNR